MRSGILIALGLFMGSLSAWAGDNATAPGDSCAGGAITAGMQQALNNGIYLCTTTGATQNWYPEALYIGTSSATCDSAHAGLTRYNSGALELCNGTSWVNSGNAATIVLGSTATGANPQRSGDATTGLFSPAASTVAVTTAGTEALRVTATGSVGMGTTTPSAVLTTKGTTTDNTASSFIAVNSAGTTILQARNDGVVQVPTSTYVTTAVASPIYNGQSNVDDRTVTINTKPLTSVTFGVAMTTGTMSQPSGSFSAVKITPTYNQTSGTAANTDLLINRTQTALGSGSQYLLDAQVGGTTKFNVSNTGQSYFAGNLGIGTTSPTYDLSLGGSAARTIWMERHTTANTAGNNLSIQAGGATSAATNKAGGNLVLSSGTSTGTGSSQIQFQTAAAGSSGTSDNTPATVMTLTSTGNLQFLYGKDIRFNNNVANDTIPALSVGTFGGQQNALVVGNATGAAWPQSIQFWLSIYPASPAEAMRIAGDGNIGIGTTSPTNLLSLGGNAARTIWMERRTTANTAGNNLTIQAGGAASGATDKNGGNLVLSSGIGTGASTSQIQFKVFPAGSAGTADTSAVTAMALSATSSTQPVLALGGSSMIAADTTTGGSEALGLLRGTTGTPGTTALIVGTGSSNGNGASLSASGTWTNASDARIKEHVRPIAYGLDALLALKPVAYEMKGTHDPQIGFIAQEVEPIIPEVVFHPQNPETEHFGLSYGNMVAVTVKAIQEQEQTIRTQQATINLLAEKVRQLELRLGQLVPSPTVH